MAGQHWLHDRQVCPPADSGEGDVREPSWNQRTVQPHQEMSEVLSLGLGDCPGVGWSHGVPRDITLSFHEVRNGIDKHPLVVRETQDEGVTLRRDDGCILAIDNARRLVAVLVDDDGHPRVREDRWTASHLGAGNTAEGFLASKEVFHHDGIDPLSSCSGYGHYAGVRLVAERTVDVVVTEGSSRTEHKIFLELVQLPLAWLDVADHLNEGLVVLVNDSKLLLQGVLHRVLLSEGVVVEDGHGVANPALYRLQGLLLTTIACDDNLWIYARSF